VSATVLIIAHDGIGLDDDDDHHHHHKRVAWRCRGCGCIPNAERLAIIRAKFFNVWAKSTATFTQGWP